MKKIKEEPTTLYDLLNQRSKIRLCVDLTYSNNQWTKKQQAIYVFCLLTNSLTDRTIKIQRKNNNEVAVLEESDQKLKAIYDYFDGLVTLDILTQNEQTNEMVLKTINRPSNTEEQKTHYNMLGNLYNKLPNVNKLIIERTQVIIEWYE